MHRLPIKAFEKIGGLYENAILGSGDNIILYSLLNNGVKAINENSTEDSTKYVNGVLSRILALKPSLGIN